MHLRRPAGHRSTPLFHLGSLATALLLSACADAPTAPDASPTSARGPRLAVQAGPVCEEITFNGFGQGASVTQVTAFGMPITVSTTAYLNSGGGAAGTGAVAFETNGFLDGPGGVGSVVMEDADLQYQGEDSPIDPDVGGGKCPGCSTLGKLLVIQDVRGFDPWGDSPWGGLITFSANFGASAYNYSIQQYTAVDMEPSGVGLRLRIDGGAPVAQSTNLGNGSVEVVNVGTAHTIANSFSFELGTPAIDGILGSGGIDNIRICRTPREVTGGEGCTLGYWKQQHHHDSWVGYTPGQALSTAFDFTGGASAFASLAGNSFLTALDYDGGSGAISAARLLLKQAVAALLNAASPDVDYAMTTQQIVDQVNAALDSGNRDTMLALKDKLDGYNNAGCPLN